MPHLCYPLLSELDHRSCRVEGGTANGNLENVIFAVVLYFYDYDWRDSSHGQESKEDQLLMSLMSFTINQDLCCAHPNFNFALERI